MTRVLPIEKNHAITGKKVWEKSLHLLCIPMERPGSFSQRLPLVSKALTQIESMVFHVPQLNVSEGRFIWTKALEIVSTLYARAPTPTSVPVELALQAIRIRMRVEENARKAKALVVIPSWGSVLQVARYLFRSVESGPHPLLKHALLEVSVQFELDRQRSSHGSSREKCIQDAYLPAIESVEELLKERQLFMKHMFSTKKVSSYCISRLLKVDKELHCQAGFYQDRAVHPSWEETLRCVTHMLSKHTVSITHNRNVYAALCEFALLRLSPKVGRRIVMQSIPFWDDRAPSVKTALQSGSKLTLLLLCVLSVSGDLASLTMIFDRIRPGPSFVEISTVLLESMSEVHEKTTDGELSTGSARFQLFARMYDSAPSNETNLQERPLRTEAQLLKSELLGVLRRILDKKHTNFFAIGQLISNSTIEPAFEHLHRPLRDECLSMKTTNTVEGQIKRFLLNIVSRSANRSSSLTKKRKTRDPIWTEISIPLYETSQVDQEDSSTLAKNIVVHSRSITESSYSRKDKVNAFELLRDLLKSQPAALSHGALMKTLMHIRHGGKKKLWNSSNDYWKSMLALFPLLRQDHPDIRAELLNSFVTRLVQIECDALANRASGQVERESSAPFWRTAMAYFAPDDLENTRLASIVLQIAILHPARWAFALNFYCATAAVGLINTEQGERRVLTESNFVQAISKAPRKLIANSVPLPATLKALFQQSFSRSIQTSIEVLRCAYFGDYSWTRSHLCSSWEMALGLLQNQPEAVITDKTLGSFVLLAICESSSVHRAENSSALLERCVIALEKVFPSSAVTIQKDPSLSEIAIVRSDLLNILDGKPSDQQCQTSRKLEENVPCSFATILLIRTVIYICSYLVASKQSKVRESPSMDFHCTQEKVSTWRKHSHETQFEKSSLPHLLAIALASSGSLLNQLLSKLIRSVTHRPTSLQSEPQGNLQIDFPNPSSNHQLTPFRCVVETRTVETSSNKFVKYQRPHEMTAPSAHSDILAECPELSFSQQKMYLPANSNSLSGFQLLFVDGNFAVVICPPYFSAPICVENSLGEIRRIVLNKLFSPVECLHKRKHNHGAFLENGQSLLLFVHPPPGIPGYLPIARELCITCGPPFPAVASFPSFVTPTFYRYIVFTKFRDGTHPFSFARHEWLVDLQSKRILSIGPDRRPSSQFLARRYSLNTVLLRIIAPSTDEAQSHSMDPKIKHEQISLQMLEVSCRHFLSPAEIDQLLEMIGLQEASVVRDAESNTDTRQETTCANCAMVEIRQGEFIIETTLPKDMDSHAATFFSSYAKNV
ncbi:DNA methylase [Perkinsela sp. CCAP 1560/4]|nr:DNA methylase [Perkinsela sp. CCAP 1560/4]|eukprot:KNH04758.1 DNA methylase [Perkinsela sp. CCAP 1560/4]